MTQSQSHSNNSSSSDTSVVGVVSIGRKRPGFDQQWNDVMRREAAAALRSLGVATAGGAPEIPVDEPTMRAALDRIAAAGATTLLVLQPSMGNGQLALTVAQRWPGPVVLWATPERPEGEKVSSCSLVAQHLWSSLMRQLNRPFELIIGRATEAATQAALSRALAVCRGYADVRRARLGLIGAHAPGFIAMEADPFAMQSQLGVQLQRLSLPQFIERCAALDERAVRDDVDRVRAMNLPMNGVTVNDLAVNSRYYLALREILAEEALDALALQEWPELPNTPGQWPYLAMSRLADEGQIVAMEGDADGAITALAGRAIGAGFGYLTDWLEHDARTVHFWHAGMAPISWCERASLGRHFNIEKPLVVDGPIKPDEPITAARIWRVDGRYRATAFQGKTIRNPRELTGNTALAEFARDEIPGGSAGGDMNAWFDTLVHAGLPHHVAIFRGHHADTFRRLARMLRVDWVG
jgi:L-fucose isomerase-like protein